MQSCYDVVIVSEHDDIQWADPVSGSNGLINQSIIITCT